VRVTLTNTTTARRVRVAFVGSSSIAPGTVLAGALAGELGLGEGDWITLGRGSTRLSHWARPEWPADLHAQTIVVLLTGNDTRPTAAAVTAVDRALRAIAPVVVWLPPLPYPAASRVAGADQRMRAAQAEAGVARIATNVRLQASHWAGVHLTPAGYRAYASQVGPTLRAALAPILAMQHSLVQRVPEEQAPQPRERERAPEAQREGGPPAPSSSLVGTLVTTRGERLPLTSTDALWMARALAGEGGGEVDAYAITSTMLRRWAGLRDAGQRRFGSLTDLVVGRFRSSTPYEGDSGEVELRGYCQPVSVQWRNTGGPRADRRRRIRSLGWDAVEPYRRQAVLRMFTGRAPLTAPASVHFAVRSLVEQGMARNPDWRIVSTPGAQGVFVSTANSRARGEPRILGADQAIAPAMIDRLPARVAAPLERARVAIDRIGVDRPVLSVAPLIAIGAAIAAIAGVAVLARDRAPHAEPPLAEAPND
jgi:hypothetical protein